MREEAKIEDPDGGHAIEMVTSGDDRVVEELESKKQKILKVIKLKAGFIGNDDAVSFDVEQDVDNDIERGEERNAGTQGSTGGGPEGSSDEVSTITGDPETRVSDVERRKLERTLNSSIVILHVLPLILLVFSFVALSTSTQETGRSVIWMAIVGWTIFSSFSWFGWSYQNGLWVVSPWSSADAIQQVQRIQRQSFGAIFYSLLTVLLCTPGTMADEIRIPSYAWGYYFIVGILNGILSFGIWYTLLGRVEPYLETRLRGSEIQRPKKWILLITSAIFIGSIIVGIVVFATKVGSLSVDESKFPDPATSLYRKPYPYNFWSFATMTNGAPIRDGDSFYGYHFWLVSGTPVVASQGGEVVEMRQNVKDTLWNRKVYKDEYVNNFIRVKHEDGSRAVYFCIQMGSASVKVGDEVEQGQIIALAGMGGSGCSAPGVGMYVLDEDWNYVPTSFQDIGIPRPLLFYK